jgi:NAD(P)-dependent dehydrogenase (short-subunit alcohol dehydrogenase family)
MDEMIDKVVMLTGAASGIGLETAKLLGARGARLMLSDVDAARGEAVAADLTAQGAEAAFAACDVTDGEAVEQIVAATVARFGRLDCAVNNAGVEHPHMKLADHDDDQFDRTIAINLKGVYLCMKYELQQMVKQGGGVIVNLASLAGLGGAPGLGAYVASKHGVVGLTRTAALEYAKRGIRVNAVCPSFTNTEMVQRMIAQDPKMEQILTNASPMKRMGEPHEVACAVAWLCSDESSFTNGQTLALDGGITAW